jgi:alpha-L-fucosidase
VCRRLLPYKSDTDLILKLVDVASKGGNFLLNVGPTADGEFPTEAVDRLQAIGAWMSANGEAIHGTGPSPFPSLAWGRATTRALGELTRLYLTVFEYPQNGVLVVPGLLNDVRRAVLLEEAHGAGARTIGVTRHGDDLHLNVSDIGRRLAGDLVVVLDIDGEPDVTVPPVIEADAPIFVDAVEVRIASTRPNVELRYTVDGNEPTAQSRVAAGPVRQTETATVKARCFRGAQSVSPSAAATFTRVEPTPAVDAGPAAPGLEYATIEGEVERLPDFEAAAGARRGTARDLDLAVRPRDARFAVQFRGFLRVPANGVYRFFFRSDDGSRLWVGGQLLVDNDGLRSSRELSAPVALAAGLHPVTVAMFEATGGFELNLRWSGPGFTKQRVPASAFARTP